MRLVPLQCLWPGCCGIVTPGALCQDRWDAHTDHFCPWDHLGSPLCLWEPVFVCWSLFLGLKLHVRPEFTHLWCPSHLLDPLLPLLSRVSTSAAPGGDNHQPWGQEAEPGCGSSLRVFNKEYLCISSLRILMQDTNLISRSQTGHLCVNAWRFSGNSKRRFFCVSSQTHRWLRNRVVSLMSSPTPLSTHEGTGLSESTTVLCHSWSKPLCLQGKRSDGQLNNS